MVSDVSLEGARGPSSEHEVLYKSEALELRVARGWAYVAPGPNFECSACVIRDSAGALLFERVKDIATGGTVWRLPVTPAAAGIDGSARSVMRGAASAGLTSAVGEISFLVQPISAKPEFERFLMVPPADLGSFLSAASARGENIDPKVLTSLMLVALESDEAWEQYIPSLSEMPDTALSAALDRMGVPRAEPVLSQDREEKPFMQILDLGSTQIAHRTRGIGAVVVAAVADDEQRDCHVMVQVSQPRMPRGGAVIEPIAGLLDKPDSGSVESVRERVVGEASEEAKFKQSGPVRVLAIGPSSLGLSDEHHVFAVLPGVLDAHDGSLLSADGEGEAITRGEPIVLTRAGISAFLTAPTQGAEISLTLLSSLLLAIGHVRFLMA